MKTLDNEEERQKFKEHLDDMFAGGTKKFRVVLYFSCTLRALVYLSLSGAVCLRLSGVELEFDGANSQQFVQGRLSLL